jgi:hypothetical protein
MKEKEDRALLQRQKEQVRQKGRRAKFSPVLAYAMLRTQESELAIQALTQTNEQHMLEIQTLSRKCDAAEADRKAAEQELKKHKELLAQQVCFLMLPDAS